MAARVARADQPEDQARRDYTLYAVTLGGARPLPQRRAPRDRQQYRRAVDPPNRAQSKKNALFAGSDGGAEHWAVIALLIETCKLNDVDPLGYLAHVLTRIVSAHPNSQIDNLLPWAYIAAHELKAVA